MMKSVFPAGVVTFLLLALASGCGQAGQNQYTAKATADRDESTQASEPADAAESEAVNAPAGAPNVELLTQTYPNLDVEGMRKTDAGLWEISQGAAYGYLTSDGRYLVQGDLVDLESGESLTENRRNESRKLVIDQIGEEQMITFSPKGETKHVMYVFTDIDCGYCRKLHRELDDYLDRGIEVRYLFYPRSGPGTSSFTTAESVWCADDRQQALTRAKASQKVPSKQCDNPVMTHYAAGQQVGLRGTPLILLADGTSISGYMPAEPLEQRMIAEGL